MNALIYRPEKKWRFVTALTAAAAIHLAAITFATTQKETPTIGCQFPGPPEVFLVPPDPISDPPTEQFDPLPTPPQTTEDFVEPNSTPPPVKPPKTHLITPLVRATNNPHGPVNLSSAKVFAVSAPRPEYPYEARRSKITGEGVAAMTVDPASGQVSSVAMVKSTGNPVLDNAALSGFRRWRFKPGTVSSVRCPITFTLVGASY